MEVLVIGDAHFGLRNNSKFFNDKLFDFFSSSIFPTIVSRQIKKCIFLGDVFDNRKNVDVFILNQVHEQIFAKFQELEVEVFIIIGNHDIFFKNTIEINSLNHLEDQFSNIKLIKEPQDIKFDSRYFAFTPWIVESEKDNFYKFLSKSKSDVLFGHLEVNEFEMVPGKKCDFGFDGNIFSKFEKVISGHFHVRSTIGNIIYPSTPIEHNWSDYMLEKGFAILNIENLEIEYIDNPDRIFKKIVFDSSINILEFNYQEYANCIVKIYVDVELIKDKKFTLFNEKLNGVVYNSDLVVLDKITETISEIVIDKAIDIKDQISDFVSSLKDLKFEVLSDLDLLYNEAIEKMKSEIV